MLMTQDVAVERSVILCETEEFSVDENWLLHQTQPSRSLSHELVSQEREMIESALEEGKAESRGHPERRPSSDCQLRRWIPRSGRCGSTSVAFIATNLCLRVSGYCHLSDLRSKICHAHESYSPADGEAPPDCVGFAKG